MKTYHDIAGDGGSDVLGQVLARQRAIEDALAGVRRIVAVGSGKGGVGKSTTTMGLARAFRERGQAVAILDADFNGPSQARLAGLEGAPWVPGDGGLALPRRPDGIGVASTGSLLAADRPLAFDTVSKGEQQTWRATRELAMLAQLLHSVAWGELDLLLVDLPPGAERSVQYAELLAPLGGASKRVSFVVVTVPSDVSRGVVARSLTALAEVGDEENPPPPVLGYVENMAGYFCRECGEVRPLFPEPTVRLDAPCLGRVPFDPELAALCDRGWPAGSPAERGSEAYRCIKRIADVLDERLDSRSQQGEGASPAPDRPRALPGEGDGKGIEGMRG